MLVTGKYFKKFYEQNVISNSNDDIDFQLSLPVPTKN